MSKTISISNRTKYFTFSILDFALTFGGPLAIIIFNYVDENTNQYKITLTGIILIIALLFVAKGIFEKHYRDKLDTLLQQLAKSDNAEVKEGINKEIDKLKMEQNIYSRITLMLPFACIYAISYFGEVELHALNGCVGLVLLFLASGSVFNVVKKPAYEKWQYDKLEKKYSK